MFNEAILPEAIPQGKLYLDLVVVGGLLGKVDLHFRVCKGQMSWLRCTENVANYMWCHLQYSSPNCV